ncbi:MAG TPA: PTS sugar transporter subunit IIA [Candidatus Brocadiia bacterium]|nr:PTS sugar transporter subunit IIA [Candidatus Brocadiia bacterium]
MYIDRPTKPCVVEQAPGIIRLPQAANCPQVAEGTLLRMAQRGEAPAAKAGSQWRFMRTIIDDWPASQMRVRLHTQANSGTLPGEDMPAVEEDFRSDLMNRDAPSGSREKRTRSITQPLIASGVVCDSQALFSSIHSREMMASTAIGGGWALPHPHRAQPGLFPSPAIAASVYPKGADCGAPDRRLVDVFFTVCATSDVTHVRLMAKVAWLANDRDFPSSLRGAPSTRAVHDLLAARVAA